MGPFEIHFARLLQRWPGARVQPVENVGTLVSLAGMPLPQGWNKQTTDIHFFAPTGYPYAKPDCFWADEDLRLATGALPQNANNGNPMTGLGKNALWFSWHTEHWNASRDDLLTWVASIKDRLSRLV